MQTFRQFVSEDLDPAIKKWMALMMSPYAIIWIRHEGRILSAVRKDPKTGTIMHHANWMASLGLPYDPDAERGVAALDTANKVLMVQRYAKSPTERLRFTPRDVIAHLMRQFPKLRGYQVYDQASLGSDEPLRESKTSKVFHGGDLKSDRRPAVTYWTPNREMAKSYVGMTKDRFGGEPEVHEKNLTLRNPASWEVIRQEATKLGFDHPDDYTPASVFDAELFTGRQVRALVARLKAMGFDGTILDDIAYGTQITDKAWIEFN